MTCWTNITLRTAKTMLIHTQIQKVVNPKKKKSTKLVHARQSTALQYMASPVGRTLDSRSPSWPTRYCGGRAMQPRTCPLAPERASGEGLTTLRFIGPHAARTSPSHAAVTHAHAAERFVGLDPGGQTPSVHHAVSSRAWRVDALRGQSVAGTHETLPEACRVSARVPQSVKGVAV